MKLAGQILIIMILLAGCKTSAHKMSVEEYAAWSETENYPYRMRAEKSGIIYDLKVYTTDLELSRAIFMGDAKVEQAGEFRKAFEKNTTAVLKITLPDAGSTIYDYNTSHPFNRSERVSYFSFDYASAFRAVDLQGDTIDCVYAAVEPGMSSYYIATANLEFPLNYADIRTIVYKDDLISGSTVLFHQKQADKKQPPKLKF